MELKEQNRLDAIVNITKIPLDQEKYFVLNQEQDWVREILCELNEKADDNSDEEKLAITNLSIELTIIKKFKPDEGEFLLVKGGLTTNYVTRCVRTLDQMEDSLELDFLSCFMHERMMEEDSYKDQLETYQEGEVYELYFFDKNLIKFSEMIHEIIFLNLNQYPIKDHDRELVWAKDSSETKQ